KRLLKALDAAQFPVTAALWYYLPDGGPWRLLFASPVVQREGPRAAYRTIQQVMAKSGPYPFGLDTIWAASTDEPIVMELRLFAGTDGAPFIGGFDLQKTQLGDIFIDRAYVYRAERIVGKSGTVEMICATPEAGHKTWRARKATLK